MFINQFYCRLLLGYSLLFTYKGIMNFSNKELVDMIWILAGHHKNTLLAVKLYHERFPERQLPEIRNFGVKKWIDSIERDTRNF